MEAFNEKLLMADRGDMNAALEIAHHVLFDDDLPIEDDILKRVKNYLADAVDNGSGIAMRMVGDMYANARGVEKDLDKAAFWYEKAAEKGISEAVELLQIVKPDELDYEKLFKDYATAAMAGDPLGYFRIGEMYEEGNYVSQNDEEAFNCFILAHKLAVKTKESECYPDICMKIGEYLYKGKGNDGSTMDARTFFEEANDYYRILVNKGDNSKLELMKKSEEALTETKAVLASGCHGIV